jgi:hypothetical protein
MQLLGGWDDFKRPVNIAAVGLGAIGLIFATVTWYLSQQNAENNISNSADFRV